MRLKTWVLLPVVALLAAACGSGASNSGGVASLSGDPSSTTTTVSQQSQEQAALAFAKCMRDHGVDIPDPTVDANGNVQLFSRPQSNGTTNSTTGTTIDRQTRQAAFSACSSYLQGFTQGFTQQDQTQIQDTLVKFAQCMRQNGYNMPDPNFSQGAGGGLRTEINRNDPAFQKALTACQSILSGLGGGRGPGGLFFGGGGGRPGGDSGSGGQTSGTTGGQG